MKIKNILSKLFVKYKLYVAMTALNCLVIQTIKAHRSVGLKNATVINFFSSDIQKEELEKSLLKMKQKYCEYNRFDTEIRDNKSLKMVEINISW